MNEKIRQEIIKVKTTGKVNMFDSYGVQRIANEMNLFELVIFIEEHRKAYGKFILTGDVEALDVE